MSVKLVGWVWSLEKSEKSLAQSLRGWDRQPKREEGKACFPATAAWTGLGSRICSDHHLSAGFIASCLKAWKKEQRKWVADKPR